MSAVQHAPTRGKIGLVLWRLHSVGYQVPPAAMDDTTILWHNVQYDHHPVPGSGRQPAEGSLFHPHRSGERRAHRQHVGDNHKNAPQRVLRDTSGIVVDAIHVRGSREHEEAGAAGVSKP